MLVSENWATTLKKYLRLHWQDVLSRVFIYVLRKPTSTIFNSLYYINMHTYEYIRWSLQIFKNLLANPDVLIWYKIKVCLAHTVLKRKVDDVRRHNSTIKMPTSPVASPIQLQWTPIPKSNWNWEYTGVGEYMKRIVAGKTTVGNYYLVNRTIKPVNTIGLIYKTFTSSIFSIIAGLNQVL